MNTQLINKPHIIDENALFATFQLSLSAFTPHDERSEALRSIYTDMLLAGCGPYDRAAFLDTLATLGAAGSIVTDDDTVIVRFRARREVLKKVLALLVLIFEEPHFAPNELARIKKRFAEELKLAKEDAKGRSYQNFIDALVSKTDRRYAYDLDIIRTSAEKVTVKDMRTLHKIVRAGAVRYACGGTSADCNEIERTMRRLRFSIDPTSFTPAPLTVKPISERKVILTDIPHRSNIEFNVGAGITMLRTDPDFAALHFGMSVLGLRGGFTGRLMSIVREKEGLTYGIYGQLEGVRAHEEGFWRISTFFAPKDAVQGITSTIREIERIRTDGITNDELVRFKQILATRFALVEDSLLKRVNERFAIESLGLTPAAYAAYKEEIAHMDRSRVNEALRRYIDPARMVISGAGPIQTVAAELRTFAQ
jgi:zinc protease